VLKPQFLVAEGDFFSLYPTVIVAHNISPEMLADASTVSNVIDANTGLSG
jgi:DNA polymerase elongation subunit (family B)